VSLRRCCDKIHAGTFSKGPLATFLARKIATHLARATLPARSGGVNCSTPLQGGPCYVYACCLFILANLATTFPSRAQLASWSKILSAKTVYFEDQINVDAGNAAPAQLRKWGRYQIVQNTESADLIFLLSASPYRGGQIIFASGQTGSVDVQGNVQEDRVPDYNRQSPVRYAYLTVIDSKNGQKPWSDSQVWGGLLTGQNSAGKRVAKRLPKQVGR
jgi:hypothetical protein